PLAIAESARAQTMSRPSPETRQGISTGRSSWRSSGIEKIGRGSVIGCGHPCVGETSYHANDIHGKQDVARSEQNITQCAGPQKRQCRSGDFQEVNSRVLQLEAL